MAEKKTIRDPEIKRLLIALIEEHKAGSPTDSNVYWISLKPWSIARMLWERHQIKLSNGIVKRQLKELGYGYRKQSKQLPTGHYARRDEQFKIICLLVSIMGSQSPVLSIDCKKKEQLGNLYRAGKCYCTQAVNVYDHDYQHLSEGKVIPHGIYDLKANQGYISIGSSGETADFIIDNLLWWWWNYGIHQYPDARNIVLLCDAGGANSYRHHIFKHRLMEFARETGLSVIVCHYPPYCSKWNPIEHRLFSQVHKAIEGVVFTDYPTVKKLIEKTSTQTGLTVVVRLNLKEYEKGIKVDKSQIDPNRISFHPQIPELNYRIYP
ncbi:MAG: ISAzo13 family transposase [Bacteroidia bacterium]|nr:ISAzo13 family transposase [Bacteroidia bacterium]MCB9231802.1 ISAzo13 family transposase [Bacteroidia bacterium]MCB9232092.1 ISAzo13 family transposase [Bacteroidia bacterium]MCB9232097.1 ISAzo13 family transposase [Bacteroidia bacterium]MCB9232155.1 ISAzo13 family transposase [Bacteroidia bacterium]